MRYKLTCIIACCSVLLTACTDSPPAPDPNALTISSFDNELWSQHLDNLTLIEDVSITEVYSDQWKEYAIFCGYTDVASLAEDLGIPNAPFEKNTRISESSSYLYLSDKAGAQEWIFAGGDVEFCSADDLGIASLAPASKPQYFKLNDSGLWDRIETPPQNSTEPTTTSTATENPHHKN